MNSIYTVYNANFMVFVFVWYFLKLDWLINESYCNYIYSKRIERGGIILSVCQSSLFINLYHLITLMFYFIFQLNCLGTSNEHKINFKPALQVIVIKRSKVAHAREWVPSLLIACPSVASTNNYVFHIHASVL